MASWSHGFRTELEKSVDFSNLFQHYFPQMIMNNNEVVNGLPALVTIPDISISRYDKNGRHIETKKTDNIIVNKGDSLTFTICNKDKYNYLSKAWWTVRNIGKQANDANDIGHVIVSDILKNHKRDTLYTGSHTIECMVKLNGSIVGVKTVTVKVKPASKFRRKPRINRGKR